MRGWLETRHRRLQCWWRGGHQRERVKYAVYVSEHAPKPPSTYCSHCGKEGV